MKLLFILLLAAFAMPAAAQQNGIETIPDTTENKIQQVPDLPSKKSSPPFSTLRKKESSDLMLSQKEKMKMRVLKSYTCPLHPHFHAGIPGRCPDCGTLLTRATSKEMKVAVNHVYGCSRHPHIAGERGTVCGECGRSLTRVKKYSLGLNKQDCNNKSKIGSCLSCANQSMRSAKEKMKMDLMKVCCCSS